MQKKSVDLKLQKKKTNKCGNKAQSTKQMVNQTCGTRPPLFFLKNFNSPRLKATVYITI